MATPQQLASFPAQRTDRMHTPALLTERGFSLRALHDGDLPWLRELYASTRNEEMDQVPWPQIAKRNFLDQQFALQHTHYLKHFADADFHAIEHVTDGPVGRYYLQRTTPDHLIIDIALMPKIRGHGIGAALIKASQHDAQASGNGMHLHVAHHNHRARQLYERLEFLHANTTETHLHMRWRSRR